MDVECEIKYDNANGVFFGGQKLSGLIIVKVYEPLIIEKINVHLKGFAKTHWQEYKMKTNILFEGHEQHLDIVLPIFDHQKEFTEGEHKFHFSSILPPGLPTSLEEKDGEITYSTTVLIDTPKSEKKFNSEFFIVQPTNLNWDPRLNRPINREISEFLWCLFCKTRPIHMRVSIPKTGFIIGQNAHIRVVVENPTDIEIHEISIRLVKKIHYKANQPYENFFEDEVDMETVTRKGTFKNGDAECEIPFEIPKTTMTSRKNNSKILNLFYEFVIEAKLPTFHNDLKIKIPIVIGNIPFDEPIQGPGPSTPAAAPKETDLQFYSPH